MKNFIFTEWGDSLSVKKYVGQEKNVLIPSEYRRKPVVNIETNAFFYENTMEVLSIPPSITNISYKAFQVCNSLHKINFSEGIETLSTQCFQEMPSLKEIELPYSVKFIPSRSFYSLQNLEKVTMLNENTAVMNTAFYKCPNIKDMSLCGLGSFQGEQQGKLTLFSLKKWSFLSTMEKKTLLLFIKRRKNLKKFLFTQNEPEAISVLVEERINLSLSELNSYLKVSVEEQNTEMTAILLNYKEKKYSTDTIEAFDQNKELVALGLETPTSKQFREKWTCSKIQSGLRVSGYKGSENEEILPSKLADGTHILEISYSKSASFGHLKKLFLDEGILKINEAAFFGSRNLEEIILPESLESISAYAFARCPSLKSINISSKIKEIPAYCFSDCCSLENVELPDGLSSIGEYAFNACVSLKKLHLPDSVTSLSSKTEPKEGGVFSSCGLTSFKIPPKLTEIPEKTFQNCSVLKEIIVHDNITSFGEGAFQFCIGLDKFAIPASVTEIGASALKGCSNFADESGFLIINQVLYDYFLTESEIIVPDGVKVIGSFAFSSSPITKITLPEGLTTIEANSFRGCVHLKSIRFPESLEEIGDSAFYFCLQLRQITGLEGVNYAETSFTHTPYSN